MNAQVFRDAMALLGAVVNVVTTDGPAGRAGLTATAVCSVTDSPPTILVCINRRNRSYRHLGENGVLCVNVLSAAQQELAARFASATDIDDRFADSAYSTIETGAPALADTMVNIDCRITRIIDVGTHGVFFCEVAAIARRGGTGALFYFDRRYQALVTPPSRMVDPPILPGAPFPPHRRAHTPEEARAADCASMQLGKCDACEHAGTSQCSNEKSGRNLDVWLQAREF